MKIETQLQDDHQAKLTVEVEAVQFEETKQRAARKLAKKIKIPGFRPGKAPYAVIARQLGDGAITEEALDLLIEDIYPKVIEEAGIRPYGPGALHGMPSMEPLTLEFLVPLEAEVTLGDYRSLQKDYELPETTEEDVDRVIENLRQRQAVLEPVDRPAEVGDMVMVKISADRKVVEEGQDVVLIKERSYPIQVQGPATEGERPKYEWPYTGFSQNLLGMSENEEKTIEYSYPEDALQESFKGVSAVFHFSIESVKVRNLPELNDDFAREVGDFENMEVVRQEVRKMLEEQSLQSYDQGYFDELLEEAITQAEFKFPPQMLEHEIDDTLRNLENNLQQQNMNMEMYLKSRNLEPAALREEAKAPADNRLKKNLFLMELAKAEKLRVDQGELFQETQNTMNMLASSMPEKDAKKLNDYNVYSNIINGVMANLVTKHALERMRVIATGKLEEVLAAEKAAQEAALDQMVAEAKAAEELAKAQDEAKAAEELAKAEDEAKTSEESAPVSEIAPDTVSVEIAETTEADEPAEDEAKA